MATEQFSAAFDEPKRRLAWPRFVFGETSREMELRTLVEGLKAERERKDRRIAADREVHERSVTAYAAAAAALRDAVEKAIAERDEARQLFAASEAERARRRDEFAKAALTGLLAYTGCPIDVESVASHAVQVADATIAALDATAGSTSVSVPPAPVSRPPEARQTQRGGA